MASGSSGFRKFRLLLWKNWIIQKRHKRQTVFEVLLPIVFSILLIIIRDLAPSDKYPDASFFHPFSITGLPANLTPTSNSNKELLREIGNVFGDFRQKRNAVPFSDKTRHERRFRRQLGFLENFIFGTPIWPLAYTPNNTAVKGVMEHVAYMLDVDIDGYGFATEDEMVERLTTIVARKADNDSSILGMEEILGGVVFTNTFEDEEAFPNDISYKIRLKGMPRSERKVHPLAPPGHWNTELNYPLFQVPGPRSRWSQEGGKPGYYDEGFLAIQYAVDMALGKYISGKNPYISVDMQRMPYPPFTDDKYLVALQAWLPLILLLSYLYPAVNIVRSVVYEKEMKLKESMKMMGLPNWLHWTAWFIKSLMFLLVSTLLITVLLCTKWNGSESLAVLHNSDPTLVFAYLTVYSMTTISFCFFLSTLFSRANSAATATGLVWIFSYLPNTVLRPRYSTLSHQTKLFLCLYFNTGMSLGCMIMSMFEGTGSGIQWSLLIRGVSPDDHFTIGQVMGILLFDAIMYGTLAWYIEAIFPGEFGVPQPWYFPFTRRYWCGPLPRGDRCQEFPMITVEQEMFEPEPTGLKIGIQIIGLTKVFGRGKKMAVNNMNLNMYSGQITALLGHNGAGKTTTMAMLTGLFPPTRGKAFVSGYDIVTEIDQVRQSIGLCPQHDILFDELTVQEHILFFCELKAFPKCKVANEVQRMIQSLKMEDKIHALASTLSGGMKRKLSVGIALCADSRIVILDEPTSGMDPGARRLIWDLLQRERNGRTILLTTHYLDEADLLGDRIAIMAKGVIQCCGSSLFLKKNYGAGYRLIIVKERECNVPIITEVIASYIPDAQVHQNVGAELTYVLPNEEVAKFEALFTELEMRRSELGISSYGACQTTMDEVFLKVGEATDPEIRLQLQRELSLTIEANNSLKRKAANELESGALLVPDEDPIVLPAVNTKVPSTLWYESVLQQLRLYASHAAKLKEELHKNVSPMGRGHHRKSQKNSSFTLLFQQFWAMMVKKALYTGRNVRLSLTQVLIPVVFLALTLIIVRTLPGVNESPPQLKITMDNFEGTYTAIQVLNENNLTDDILSAVLKQIVGNDHIVLLSPETNMTTFILDKASEDLPSFNLHWMVAMVVNGNSDDSAHISAIFNNQPFHIPPLALHMVDLAILRTVLNDETFQLTAVNHPLPRTETEQLTHHDNRQNLGFQVGFNLAFGMSFLSASFALFIIKERSSNSKHLQFVSGVNFVTYWMASALWDMFFFLVPCLSVVLVLVIFKNEHLCEFDQMCRVVVVLMFYVWSMLPFMYLCSFQFSIPSLGFTRLTILNILTGMATLITVMILRIPDLNLAHIADILDWFFLLFPPYAMAAAITDLYTNSVFINICSRSMMKLLCGVNAFANPCCKVSENCGKFGCVDWNEDFISMEKLGIGRMLVIMAIEGFIFYFVLALIELKVFLRLRYLIKRILAKLFIQPTAVVENQLQNLDAEDGDVHKERLRIQTSTLDQLFSTDKLIIKNLCKSYSDGVMAVDHLNLGVMENECFGLLGINGAGKTSTFKMLTGDVPLTSGDAFVNGYSVKSDLKHVQQHVGYCPQFDALLDQMTGRETLRMYARLRGVPENDIRREIEVLADQLLVTPHLDKPVGHYSGGNKRKISTGIALIGEPPLVLLDEPTTGMDPVARRLLWDVLASVRDSGRSIILTSHSMEECEALCTRIAIMTNGKLQCLGSSQHLKSKFSEGYSVILRVTIGDTGCFCEVDLTELPGEMIRIKQFMANQFPGSIIREMQWGRFEYFVPSLSNDLTWAKVFGTLERNRQKLQIEDYSVTQTTLERVFLNFTRNQRPDSDR